MQAPLEREGGGEKIEFPYSGHDGGCSSRYHAGLGDTYSPTSAQEASGLVHGSRPGGGMLWSRTYLLVRELGSLDRHEG